MKLVSILKLSITSTVVITASWSWRFIFRWCWRPKLVFMFYPGSDKYIKNYMFKWVYEHFPIPDITPLGLMIRPGMIGVYGTTKDVLQNVDGARLIEITEKIPTFFPFSRSVSLAGSWPSLLQKAGSPNNQAPLVDASLGTIYTMDRICAQMISKKGKDTKNAVLCILGGGGFIGKGLLPKIKENYKQIFAIDPIYTQDETKGNTVYSNDPVRIRKADAVLVLTPTGDDAAPYAEHAVNGQIWGDDTYPDMSPSTRSKLKSAGVELFKPAMVDESFRFIPPLPTFGVNRIPGCLISGMVNEVKQGITDINSFYEIADTLQVKAKLFPHQKNL